MKAKTSLVSGKELHEYYLEAIGSLPKGRIIDKEANVSFEELDKDLQSIAFNIAKRINEQHGEKIENLTKKYQEVIRPFEEEIESLKKIILEAFLPLEKYVYPEFDSKRNDNKKKRKFEDCLK